MTFHALLRLKQNTVSPLYNVPVMYRHMLESLINIGNGNTAIIIH